MNKYELCTKIVDMSSCRWKIVNKLWRRFHCKNFILPSDLFFLMILVCFHKIKIVLKWLFSFNLALRTENRYFKSRPNWIVSHPQSSKVERSLHRYLIWKTECGVCLQNFSTTFSQQKYRRFKHLQTFLSSKYLLCDLFSE